MLALLSDVEDDEQRPGNHSGVAQLNDTSTTRTRIKDHVINKLTGMALDGVIAAVGNPLIDGLVGTCTVGASTAGMRAVGWRAGSSSAAILTAGRLADASITATPDVFDACTAAMSVVGRLADASIAATPDVADACTAAMSVVGRLAGVSTTELSDNTNSKPSLLLLYLESLNCDVVLNVNGTKFRSHRLVSEIGFLNSRLALGAFGMY